MTNIGKNKVRDSFNPHSEPEQYQKEAFVKSETIEGLYNGVLACHFTSITNNFFSDLGTKIGNIEAKAQNRDPFSGKIALLNFALDTELSYCCLPRCDRERNEFNSKLSAYLKLFDDIMSFCIRDEAGENMLKLQLKNWSVSHESAHYTEARDIKNLTNNVDTSEQRGKFKLPLPGRAKT